jgi:hypothetical protein
MPHCSTVTSTLQLGHGVSAVETPLSSTRPNASLPLQLGHGVSAVETAAALRAWAEVGRPASIGPRRLRRGNSPRRICHHGENLPWTFRAGLSGAAASPFTSLRLKLRTCSNLAQPQTSFNQRATPAHNPVPSRSRPVGRRTRVPRRSEPSQTERWWILGGSSSFPSADLTRSRSGDHGHLSSRTAEKAATWSVCIIAQPFALAGADDDRARVAPRDG